MAFTGKPAVSALKFNFDIFRLNLKVFGGPEGAPITDDDTVTLGVNPTISWEIYIARNIQNQKAEQSLPKATLK